MIRLQPRPAASPRVEFPLAMLAIGETAEHLKRQTCPHADCHARLRWAPVGEEAKGLVCDLHGVVWRTRDR